MMKTQINESPPTIGVNAKQVKEEHDAVFVEHPLGRVVGL